MPIVELPKARYTILEDGTLLRISIPSRKNYFAIFFLGFWLIGWVFGEIMVGGIFITGIIESLLTSLISVNWVQLVLLVAVFSCWYGWLFGL
jgi:endonuclease V-like protein UPF0215 family